MEALCRWRASCWTELQPLRRGRSVGVCQNPHLGIVGKPSEYNHPVIGLVIDSGMILAGSWRDARGSELNPGWSSTQTVCVLQHPDIATRTGCATDRIAPIDNHSVGRRVVNCRVIA